VREQLERVRGEMLSHSAKMLDATEREMSARVHGAGNALHRASRCRRFTDSARAGRIAKAVARIARRMIVRALYFMLGLLVLDAVLFFLAVTLTAVYVFVRAVHRLYLLTR
jgi:hypothetical protein